MEEEIDLIHSSDSQWSYESMFTRIPSLSHGKTAKATAFLE